MENDQTSLLEVIRFPCNTSGASQLQLQIVNGKNPHVTTVNLHFSKKSPEKNLD